MSTPGEELDNNIRRQKARDKALVAEGRQQRAIDKAVREAEKEHQEALEESITEDDR